MALLQKITAAEVKNEKIASFLSSFEERVGAVPATVELAANSEGLFEQLIGQINYYGSHANLSSELLAFIRYIAATIFENPACVSFNGELLMRMGITEQELASSILEPGNAPLNSEEQELLEFVVEGLRDQGSASVEKMDFLRSIGWQDSDIYDAVNHGFFIFAPGKMMELFQMMK